MDNGHNSHSPSHGGATLQAQSPRATGNSYGTLFLELVADFAVMFFVMYAMIATLDHFYLNISNVYMTLMMVAPMALLMLVFMRHMFRSKRANLVVTLLAVGLFATGWFGMRTQMGVGDAQLVRSMIPHHSGAILMCRKAKLSDPELIQLCRDIVGAQRREVNQMEHILSRL